MANLPINIAGQSVEEVLAKAGGNNVLIPEGIYKAMFVEGALADTKSGTGKMLVMKAVITEGQYAQTEFTERLNIVNDNATAVKIAVETLARIAKAVGLDKTPANSDALLRKPLLITVKTEKSNGTYTDNDGNTKPYPDRSAIDAKGYKPLPVAALGGPAASQSPFAGQSFSTEPNSAGGMPWEQQA